MASGEITIGSLISIAQRAGWNAAPWKQRANVAAATSPLPSAPPEPPVPAAPHAPPLPPGALLLTAAQLRQLPATPYVVRGLLPARGLAAIYGGPGSGKSFLAIDLAHAIAVGRAEWFGFHVKQAPVAYVALEGEGGLRKRVDALELHTRQPCGEKLRFWRRSLQLLVDGDVDLLAAEVIAALGTGAVVIIDTLNQASPGADENSSQDMGRIIAAAKQVAAKVGGLVILVHHSGKVRSQGLRGHSSLLAAMDAVIEVTKETAGRRWCVAKAKDDSGDVERDFDLVEHAVGQDAFGPITSCAVEPTIRAPGVKKVRVSGKHQKAALAEIRRLLTAPGQTMPYPDVLEHVAGLITTAKPRERAKEAVDALIRGGHLSATAAGVCLQ